MLEVFFCPGGAWSGTVRCLKHRSMLNLISGLTDILLRQVKRHLFSSAGAEPVRDYAFLLDVL